MSTDNRMGKATISVNICYSTTYCSHSIINGTGINGFKNKNNLAI